MATVAGAGFFGTLGVSAVRGKLSHPAPVTLQAVAVSPATPAPSTVTALAHQTAPEPAAGDAQPDDRDSTDPLPAASLPVPSFPAPTYDQQTAARDWAAAHSARSR